MAMIRKLRHKWQAQVRRKAADQVRGRSRPRSKLNDGLGGLKPNTIDVVDCRTIVRPSR